MTDSQEKGWAVSDKPVSSMNVKSAESYRYPFAAAPDISKYYRHLVGTWLQLSNDMMS
jgi:hypothetical protein